MNNKFKKREYYKPFSNKYMEDKKINLNYSTFVNNNRENEVIVFKNKIRQTTIGEDIRNEIMCLLIRHIDVFRQAKGRSSIQRRDLFFILKHHFPLFLDYEIYDLMDECLERNIDEEWDENDCLYYLHDLENFLDYVIYTYYSYKETDTDDCIHVARYYNSRQK